MYRLRQRSECDKLYMLKNFLIKGKGYTMLEKLKDIFYDKNDIIVALAMVVVGAFIISSQVDSIMSYPEQLADQLQQEQLEQEPLQQEGSSAKPGDEEVSDFPLPDPDVQQEPEIQEPPAPPVQEPQPQTPPASSEFKVPSDKTVEIPSGAYSQKIAQILADAGVVPSADAFLKAISDAGLETKLKAGTFKIPAGSTLNDVVKIVTK